MFCKVVLKMFFITKNNKILWIFEQNIMLILLFKPTIKYKSTHSIKPKFGKRSVVKLIDFPANRNPPHFLTALFFISFL